MSVSPEYPIKRRCDVTDGEEWRHSPEHPWTPNGRGRGSFTPASTLWVEARPKRQPDPLSLSSAVVDGRTLHVTTVGEMRDRTDLDKWQYASTWSGSWQNAAFHLLVNCTDDDLPVIVRRVWRKS